MWLDVIGDHEWNPLTWMAGGRSETGQGHWESKGGLCQARIGSQWVNGNFRILKWRYCTIFWAIFSGDIPWNLGLMYGRYLQFTVGSWNGHWMGQTQNKRWQFSFKLSWLWWLTKGTFFGVPYGTSHVVQMGQHQVVSYSHISHIVSCLGSNGSRFVKFLLMVESRRRMDAWAFCVH